MNCIECGHSRSYHLESSQVGVAIISWESFCNYKECYCNEFIKDNLTFIEQKAVEKGL